MKQTRQQHILEILRQTSVSSQGELVDELARRGVAANQATISRDLKELGVVRVPDGGGGYRYGTPRTGPVRDPWQQLPRRFEAFVTRVDGNDQLIVIRTLPGCAHAVAIDLDALDDDDIVGTVAGDDTVLVIPRTPRARRQIQTRFEEIFSASPHPRPGP